MANMLSMARSETTEPKVRAVELWLKGLTYGEIGMELGVSRQRAQQMIRPTTAIYNLVRARANESCESCGVKLGNGHVHHKTTDGKTPEDFNDVSNLMYLCASCHGRKHDVLSVKSGRKSFRRNDAQFDAWLSAYDSGNITFAELMHNVKHRSATRKAS